MLNIESLTKRFGTLTALDSVSLNIEQGEFFGLLGPNGAGKSTLMSLIAGLRQADLGEVRLEGKVLKQDARDLRALIGLVPQSPALYLELNAEQNLRIFGELFGLHGKLLNERIEEGLATAQLADRRKEAVRGFSGGMQRRLNIVAALLHRPKVLLCDEPTVGVDPQSRNAIFDYLEGLNREGMTIIYSTHYMEEAERLCSRIGIIDHGKILALGSVEKLVSQLPFEEEISFPVIEGMEPLLTKLRDIGEVKLENAKAIFRPRPEFPLSNFYRLTEEHGCPSRLFECKRPSLENLFLHLTGRKLRE